MYTIAICFLKLSMLLLYLQLSPARLYRLCVQAMIFMVVGFCIASIVTIFTSCTPLRKVWDLSITWGTCIDRPAQSIASGVLNVTTDFILLILPLPFVWKLKIPTKQKLMLFAVFMVGALYDRVLP